MALERRAEELSDQSFRFREWIKFHCDLESDELDVVVRETTDEVWRHIDCQACGRCCRLDVVTVDDNDVARLARRLDITPAEFTQRHVKMVMGEQSMVTGPCPFLKGNSCSVYEDRPTACSDFPFLHSPGFRHRMLVLIDFSSLCPVVLNTIEVLKLKLGWKRGRGRKP
ncbi:MAG: YkgJ family cysteine cluster protein [Acidobacteria bacterium]|nr:YkgJ family cysteine cluster protein [Acidobacteriota bacterium]